MVKKLLRHHVAHDLRGVQGRPADPRRSLLIESILSWVLTSRLTCYLATVSRDHLRLNYSSLWDPQNGPISIFISLDSWLRSKRHPHFSTFRITLPSGLMAHQPYQKVPWMCHSRSHPNLDTQMPQRQKVQPSTCRSARGRPASQTPGTLDSAEAADWTSPCALGGGEHEAGGEK